MRRRVAALGFALALATGPVLASAGDVAEVDRSAIVQRTQDAFTASLRDDRVTLTAILAPDFTLVGSGGPPLNRDATLAALSAQLRADAGTGTYDFTVHSMASAADGTIAEEIRTSAHAKPIVGPAWQLDVRRYMRDRLIWTRSAGAWLLARVEILSSEVYAAPA
jgi:hypothetical protein